MQHIFEFIAIKKLSTEDELYNKDINNVTKIEPETINRYWNSESSRKTKVTLAIYKALKRDFNIQDPQKELDKFYLRQLR